jgi:hypothetical protein
MVAAAYRKLDTNKRRRGTGWVGTVGLTKTLDKSTWGGTPFPVQHLLSDEKLSASQHGAMGCGTSYTRWPCLVYEAQ